MHAITFTVNIRAALFAILALSAALGGCVTLPRGAFTEAEQRLASPPGFEGVRYNQDDKRLAAMLQASMRPDAHSRINALAISGGGANGAYGAGLLYRWTSTGKRPDFQLVTGVSTGALTAPYAFLGPAWDEPMRQTYFGPKVRGLLKIRGLAGLFTPGVYSKAPLDDLVRSAVTDDLMRAVAAEHAKGRRLLVATTNLDTEEQVIWDMGAIAAKGGPKARQLFGTVLIASASVPGVFRPTLIHVAEGDRAFNEMHVDGQAESAFFAIPQTLLVGSTLPSTGIHANVYVIVNGRLEGLFALTPHNSLAILARTLDAAAKASVRTTLITTAEFCERSGCKLHVSSLPPGALDDSLDFGAPHIASLFAAGEAAIDDGTAWKTSGDAPAAKLAN
jgi:hypothetical protein